jgi:hypothetical protein
MRIRRGVGTNPHNLLARLRTGTQTSTKHVEHTNNVSLAIKNSAMNPFVHTFDIVVVSPPPLRFANILEPTKAHDVSPLQSQERFLRTSPTMEVINDYFGPETALFFKFLIYILTTFLALQYSFYMPTSLPSIGDAQSRDPMIFCVSTLLIAFIFGLSVRNRSGVCRVWATYLIIVCGCVLGARMASGLGVRDREVGGVRYGYSHS